ncbi:hypothetical protein C8F04DRAFT_269640 [Mycena alexandri]|uniref:Uncharacterized protein n=1 Tax=Mycena alexandri TaxID=1745969 RepID=A0AAD6S6N1_9AGAR|nr:hypothetical protein C8F04DRAFT_269640 [Mycena alexandri]
MLRRRPSLAGLLPAAFSSSSNLDEHALEDSVPPLPLGLARGGAAMRSNPALRGASVDDHGPGRGSFTSSSSRMGLGAGVGNVATPSKSGGGGGLIRRVSSLFRSGSKAGSPTSARYRAAASTPDIRGSASPSSPVSPAPSSQSHTSGGANKLVKRPSVKRKGKDTKLPALPPLEAFHLTTQFPPPPNSKFAHSTMSVGISSFGISSAKSVKSAKSVGVESAKSQQSHSYKSNKSRHSIFPTYTSSSSKSTPMSSAVPSEAEDDDEAYDPDAEIRRPSDLGPPTTRSLLDWEEGAEAGYGHDAMGKRYAAVDEESEQQHTPTPGRPLPRAYMGDSAYASDASEDEDHGDEVDEDDIRRPEGLGKAASLPLGSLDDSATLPWERPRKFPSDDADATQSGAGSGAHERTRAQSTPTLHILHEMLGLPPPLAARSSSSSPSPHSNSPSRSHATSNSPHRAAAHRLRTIQLPPALWHLVLDYVEVDDAVRAACVNRVLCQAARGRIYGVVDLRQGVRGLSQQSMTNGVERGDAEEVAMKTNARTDSRSRTARTGILDALHAHAHLAAVVEGLVCAGWPPWTEGETPLHLPALRALTVFHSPSDTTTNGGSSSTDALLPFLRLHPTLERLAVIGGGDADSASTSKSTDRASEHHADPTEAENETEKEKEKEKNPFLPRLTHLHAPPALAVRLLDRIAGAPFASLTSPSFTSPSLSHPPLSSAATTPGSTGTPPPNSTQNQSGSNSNKQLSAASLALLAPDPDRKLRSRLSVWGRSKSHDRLAEAFTFGGSSATSTAPNSTGSTGLVGPTSKTSTAANGIRRGASANGVGTAATASANGIKRGASANGVGSSANPSAIVHPAAAATTEWRIPRKAPPTFHDTHTPAASVDTTDSLSLLDGDADEDVVLGFGFGAEKVQLRRVESVGRAARPVFMQATGRGPSSNTNKTGEPHAHPLRVLRIAIPRPLYEGAAGAGGGKVGRAVAAVLARGAGEGEKESGANGTGKKPGLAVHLLFGPRVERRTLEKVLRTLGSGLEEALPTSVIPVATSTPSEKGKAPPSAWAVARGAEWSAAEGATGGGKG